MSSKMKKKLISIDYNYPFSIKPCSMSYDPDDDDYEIVYNGTDFEIVKLDKSKKDQSTNFNMSDIYSIASELGYDSDWETDWLNDWNQIEEDLSKKKECKHEWQATQLIFSTVYDCKKCGAKKD